MVRSMIWQARSKAQKPAAARKPLSVDQAEVARVAYELFERRGALHGSDMQDWLEAERIVQQR